MNLKKSHRFFNHDLKQYTMYNLFSIIYYLEEGRGDGHIQIFTNSHFSDMDGGTDTPEILCHIVMSVNE